MRIAIKTLGCKSNRYESDRLFELLRREHEVYELNEGVSTFQDKVGDKSDLLIVNTCTVTHVADRKSRQAVKSFKRMNPDCKVVVFGCGVNVSPQQYQKMKEVDHLAADTEAVLKLAREMGGEFERCEYEAQQFVNGMRSRALVKIQDGCDSYCSYCIIPTARGPEYSFPSKKILREVQEKEAQGFSEIVLTGINIGEWKEEGKDLGDLFEMLIEGTERVRFRVSSIEPKNFSDKFFELFKSGRFCPHLHMSLQSGSDSVLKRMRRHYLTDVFYDACRKFREAVPDIGLTTDVIVGFPGESDAEFEETCEFVRKVGFLKIHVFPYSKREKTVAAYMKNHVDEEVKKERCKKLREISDDLAAEFKQKWMGREYEVLVENLVDGRYRGFTENYIPVAFESAEDVLKKVVNVKLGELDGQCVKAVLT